MNIMARAAIALVAAAIIIPSEHYLIQQLNIIEGGLLYCAIVGFGVALILLVWRLTSPKTSNT